MISSDWQRFSKGKNLLSDLYFIEKEIKQWLKSFFSPNLHKEISFQSLEENQFSIHWWSLRIYTVIKTERWKRCLELVIWVLITDKNGLSGTIVSTIIQ